MTSVLNIEPNNLIVRGVRNGYLYTFLDNLKGTHNIKISKYYDLLNTIDEFKLKNVYAFLYLKIYKICEKNETKGVLKPLPKRSGKISPEEMNELLVEYISDDSEVFIKEIVIMNTLQLYFYPQNTL